jgi:hypothetical protein
VIVDVLLALAVALLALSVLSLLVIYLRRRLLQRDGGIVEMSLRLAPGARGRGWALGIGRFVGDDLQWYRVFSLSAGPRRTLSRRDLVVVRQRPPERAEAHALWDGAVVMECRSRGAGDVALAMGPSAVTGFLAWLEAQPPGATLPPA